MKVAISPAQRFHLANLLHPRDGKIADGQQSRVSRRVQRVLGVAHVGRVARENGGVRVAYAQDERTLHLVEVTPEAMDYLLKNGYPRDHLQDDILGELFDTLESIRGGAAYAPPEGVPDLNVDVDIGFWLPQKAPLALVKEEPATAG